MVAILFEGISDEEFFNSVLEEYSLDKNQVVFFNFQGKDNLFNISHENYNDLEKDIEVGRITKAFIVVDADSKKDPNPHRGYNSSENKIQEIIQDLKFDIPIHYYIMCNEKKEGNLESFLLSILEEKQQECISTFRNCYKYELTDKWIYNSFYKQKKHPFNYNHPHFDSLKNSLLELFNT